MFTFKFDLDSQLEAYNIVKDNIKNDDFYQKLNFYILPFMPEKFRNRVVFFPEEFEPEKIYRKQKVKILKLESEWNNQINDYSKKLSTCFPNLNDINIIISPQLYGTIGSYKLDKNKITVKPRYDRNIVGLHKLVITALVHYFEYNPKKSIENEIEIWKDKQNKSKLIQEKIIKSSKVKSMTNVLDTEFAGKLAEESAKYLEKLKSSSNFEVVKPENLTVSERNLLNLLLRNKNKLVTFDEIAEEIWKDKVFEKYSEYAITTIVKKIKKKLLQKTDKHIIQAQRGVGYILHM